MDPNINPETGEIVSTGRPPRFRLWIALMLFSVIVMGASVELKNNQGNPSSDVKYSVACSTLSSIISAVFLAAHFFPIMATILLNNLVEGAVSFALAVGWAATVAVVTKQDDQQARVFLQQSGGVINANIYYFSWGCFVTSVILFVNFTRQAFGLDLVNEISSRGARVNLWAALIATSLVVAGSSGRTLQNICKGTPNFNSSNGMDQLIAALDLFIYCKRTKFGIALGTIAVFLSIVVVGMKIVRANPAVSTEMAVAILTAILYAFGVAFITSNLGPGATIGNLYYFTWASFLLSVGLVAECYAAFTAPPPSQEDTTGSNGQRPGGSEANKRNGGGDIEIQVIDDL